MNKIERLKLFREIILDYINGVFGFLIGISVLVIAISTIKIFEILLAFFGFFVMVIDDWFVSRSLLKIRPPKSMLSLFANALYVLPFVFMILSIALIANDIRWLTGYSIGFLFYLIVDELIVIISVREHGTMKMPKIIGYINYIFMLPASGLIYATYNNLIPVYGTFILVPTLYIARRLFLYKYLL